MINENRIEICGNIAAGKTTLCTALIPVGYSPIFENFSQNPFYKDFYLDPQSYSFETEVTFLLQHYHAIKKQKKSGIIICDYSVFLDMAYADINLVGDRHKIFMEIADELLNEIGLPSKIVHLVCPEEILLQRIEERKRREESSISITYLKSLTKAISKRIHKIAHEISVITIDSNKIDFRKGIKGIEKFAVTSQ